MAKSSTFIVDGFSFDDEDLLKEAKKEAEEHKLGKAWKRGTEYLSRIEHFCVGVQAKAFDLDTLNRLAGGYFINQYEKWLPIIEQKRLDDGSMKHYNEFEDVVDELKKKRKTN